MRNAVMENIASHHIFISAAAVSDYRAESVSPHKIKKISKIMILNLPEIQIFSLKFLIFLFQTSPLLLVSRLRLKMRIISLRQKNWI